MHRTAVFVAKLPYTTWSLEINAPEQDQLSEIVEALGSIGWTHEHNVPAIDGIKTHWFFKPGSDLFQGWKPEEAKVFMPEVRKVLRRFGWTRIPKHRMTLQEMF